jgi:endonuclease YncB( thermonuclease family)
LVYLQCSKMDKYGRILATVYPPGDLLYSANQMLLNTGDANEYDGGKKHEFVCK